MYIDLLDSAECYYELLAVPANLVLPIKFVITEQINLLF